MKSYNETVGSLERQVLPQARRFQDHGITGIEAPELVPIERQTRALSAQELRCPSGAGLESDGVRRRRIALETRAADNAAWRRSLRRQGTRRAPRFVVYRRSEFHRDTELQEQ